MSTAPESLYKAFLSHDPRFDGVFYVGVVTTGIYCRPVCPVRPPKLKNCRFFESAAAAEKAGLRPCLRCRPELAPGNAPLDDSRRIALLIAQRLEEGTISGDAGVEEIAAQFDLGARQIRRIVQKEFGVSPIELLQTRRLLLAKQLLTDTPLPVTEIAFASGFSSLRRFNDAFVKQYRLTPTRLRKSATARSWRDGTETSITLQLAYRPPYDWTGLLAFLKARALAGVETVSTNEYARTVRIGPHRGWIVVRQAPQRNMLMVECAESLTPVLPALIRRLRHLFDLDAHPEIITRHLAQDKMLAPLVAKHPGLRVPGCFDGFELGLRAILGQHISVKAATTLAGRVAATFGEALETPMPGVNRLLPEPQRIAAATPAALTALGMTSARAASLAALARAITTGGLRLAYGSAPEAAIDQLTALPGIGPWTAQYIALRALGWPDAFPKEDLILRRQMGVTSPRTAEERAEDWRPWRSYAALHLWRQAAAAQGQPEPPGL